MIFCEETGGTGMQINREKADAVVDDFDYLSRLLP